LKHSTPSDCDYQQPIDQVIASLEVDKASDEV
jgi:hypothetical protein